MFAVFSQIKQSPWSIEVYLECLIYSHVKVNGSGIINDEVDTVFNFNSLLIIKYDFRFSLFNIKFPSYTYYITLYSFDLFFDVIPKITVLFSYKIKNLALEYFSFNSLHKRNSFLMNLINYLCTLGLTSRYIFFT